MIILLWSLSILNLYVFYIPLKNYTTSAGLDALPIVLDQMNYYTPDEGYQALTRLGNDGRNAYRLSNYTDFILPFLLFLSLSLPNLALGKGFCYIISPLIYMISDYIENIAEKYVLEIYPKRNDSIMMLACYSADGNCDFNTVGNNGETIINEGIQSLLIDLLSKLVVNINKHDNQGGTALHYAYRFNRTNDIVLYLLHKCDLLDQQSHKTSFLIDYINAKTRDGHDVLSFARTYDHEQIIEELCEHLSHDDYRRQEKDKTTVLYLLERHYGLNTITLCEKQYGFTPIFSADYAGQSKCFEYVLNAILNRHTSVHDLLIDRYGRTLLHLGVLSRQINIQIDSFLFVQFIAPMIYTLDYNDETPLHLAVRLDLYDMCELIQHKDANLSILLHCVAQCVNIKFSNGIDACIPILDILLKYIQNCKSRISFDLLTAINGFGYNCLETAILARNRLFVEYLLDLNNISLFKNLLCNAQILDIHYRHHLEN
ncbi:unnamed protein product [Adineta steineri]|uniref:Ankyrin repeat protein n=1 Tax=Adineta steineri TaxID=433720 RepID=A0A818UUW8_9BILA|nr:unnamed protein product [Adineta steineri]CAF3700259.1 unnamed protein product [Adineta steineri]